MDKNANLAEAAENLDLTDSENACISAAIALPGIPFPFGEWLSITLQHHANSHLKGCLLCGINVLKSVKGVGT